MPVIVLAPGYPGGDVPKPDLKPVAEAARLVDVHEMTVWRYLRLGYLTRYKSKPGAPRKTMVDMHELRRLREQPPTEPVEEKGNS